MLLFAPFIAVAALEALELLFEIVCKASDSSSDSDYLPPAAGKKPDSSSGGYSTPSSSFTSYPRLSSELETVSAYRRRDGTYVRSYVRRRPHR